MANKNQTVDVVREVKVTVAGITVFRDGSNIVLKQDKAILTIPNGAVGRTLLNEALGFVSDEAPVKASKAKTKAKTKDGASPAKRTRRTKAQMEAARLAENSAPVANVENTVGEELEVV